jgi:hypothetical protein
MVAAAREKQASQLNQLDAIEPRMASAKGRSADL